MINYYNDKLKLNCLNKKVLLLLCAVLSLAVLIFTSGFSGKSEIMTVVPVTSFGTDPSTQVSISWCTSLATAETYVEFSHSKTETSGKQLAERRKTITDKDTRFIYRADLNNLTPDTVYSYKITDSSDIVLASGFFTTAPLKSSSSWTFLQITDTQGINASDYAVSGKTFGTALAKFPDARFIMLTGDIVDNGSNINQWDWFFQECMPYISSLPIETVVGNHDVINSNGTNSGAKNFTEHFALPDIENVNAVKGTVYSFDYGDAHFAILNTEEKQDVLQEEARWLKKDMQLSSKRWKIAAMHRGLYGTVHNSSDVERIFGPAFEAAKVDLVLQGHEHLYSRRSSAESMKKGTVFITDGTGGPKSYFAEFNIFNPFKIKLQKPMYMAITVSQASLKIEAYDVSGKLMDTVNLK